MKEGEKSATAAAIAHGHVACDTFAMSAAVLLHEEMIPEFINRLSIDVIGIFDCAIGEMDITANHHFL